jgi:hypothetical protein
MMIKEELQSCVQVVEPPGSGRTTTCTW